MTAEREMLADEIERLVGALGAAETRLQEVMAARQHAGDAWDAVDAAKAAIGAFTVCHRFELLAALRTPAPAADAVELAYREGYRTCWHFNVATDDPPAEDMIDIEWRDSKARAALAALLAPVSTDEQVDQAAVRIADATLCQWGRPNDCGREGEPCLCEVAAKAALAASRGQDHALAARTACSNGGA